MFKALRHHVDVVKEFYPDIKDNVSAHEIVRSNWIPNLVNEKWKDDGSLMYPLLNTIELEDLLAELIVSVNTGEIEIIPDWSEDGRKNRDSVCEACGNLVSIEHPEIAKVCEHDIRTATKMLTAYHGRGEFDINEVLDFMQIIHRTINTESGHISEDGNSKFFNQIESDEKPNNLIRSGKERV
jgi:hypothetical protein